MEDVREEEEDGGIYEWGSDMDGEEYNDLESKRDEAMFLPSSTPISPSI